MISRLSDVPTLWQIMQTTAPFEHYEKCMFRTSNRSLMCDCAAYFAAHEARKLALEDVDALLDSSQFSKNLILAIHIAASKWDFGGSELSEAIASHVISELKRQMKGSR
jgi:hypothetical protein